MARIRTIKPEFWHDEKIGGIRRDTRLLFIGLWNYADDWGRIGGVPRVLRGLLFPFDDDIDLEAGLAELASAKLVRRYVVDGKPYIHIINFEKHQKIDKRSRSFIPGPESAESAEDSAGFGGDRRELGAGSQSLPQSQSLIVRGNGGPSEPNTLELVPSGKKPRKQSAQQRFYEWAEERRLAAVGIADQRWSAQRINKSLKEVSELNRELVCAAFESFLVDPHKQSLDPPCPMWSFASDWSKYVSKVEREEGRLGA